MIEAPIMVPDKEKKKGSLSPNLPMCETPDLLIKG